MLVLMLSTGAVASRRPALPPADDTSLNAILACRNIADPQARLACFDANAKSLAGAEESHAIVVLDRAQVRKTRRSVFGFNIPDLGLFGAKTPGEEAEDRELDAIVRDARLDQDGRWLITLDNGAVWRQTDDQVIALPPRSGSKIVIRRAALGSFFLRVDGQPGVKAQRVN